MPSVAFRSGTDAAPYRSNVMKINAKGPDFVELDYTPMIDMTFQLIAFFMILINFSDAETDDRVQLPSSTIAKPPSAPSEMPLTIQMVEDGKIIMSDKLLPNADALRPLLRNEKSVMELKRQDPKDINIIIRAHKDVKTGLVQQIIKVCQELGFEKFTLRAKSEAAY
jgi:biopolymer transport protein ExbD